MNSFNLAAIFTDHMVLQRNKMISIWGESAESNIVSVQLNNIEVAAEAENGKWVAVLPPMDACECCELRVFSNNPADHQIVIENVAIGEVWIAGGEANMEFPLKFDAEAAEFLGAEDNRLIRFFDTPKISYEGQEHDDNYSEWGYWRTCSFENAPYISAVGYYYSQQLYKRLCVPIGIIGCNWGGTSASAWISEDYLEKTPDLQIYLQENTDAIKNLDLEEYELAFKMNKLFSQSPETEAFKGDLLAGNIAEKEVAEVLSESDTSFMLKAGTKHRNRPAGLFHTMVKPIAGYSARGVIWYQGESDRAKADIYDHLFKAVIQCWREVWKEELPFLFVQLAPFRSWLQSSGQAFPVLRAQQEKVSKTVPNVYMASIMDAGMEFDLHPKQTRPIGERLALLARGKVYGEHITCEAPELDRAKRYGNNIKIKLRNVGSGLRLKGNYINGLQIFVNSEEVKDFEANILDHLLYIYTDQLKENSKIEVRFAWIDYVDVNLYSSEGLPVKPFKIQL